jgi:hypothetical protein
LVPSGVPAISRYWPSAFSRISRMPRPPRFSRIGAPKVALVARR